MGGQIDAQLQVDGWIDGCMLESDVLLSFAGGQSELGIWLGGIMGGTIVVIALVVMVVLLKRRALCITNNHCESIFQFLV